MKEKKTVNLQSDAICQNHRTFGRIVQMIKRGQRHSNLPIERLTNEDTHEDILLPFETVIKLWAKQFMNLRVNSGKN